MNTLWKTMVSTGLAAALMACGGGGGSGGGSGGNGTTGELTLRITDAPVDGATSVNITIKSVELKLSGSDTIKRIRMDGNGQRINLMDYSGLTTLPLFTEKVTSGQYQWARFELADDATICSGPSSCEALEIPPQQEIKTSGNFSVPSDGVIQYVVDWDLRKSVVMQGDNYQLKPVLHLRRYSSEGVSTVGYIHGSVNSTELDDCSSPVVYLFEEGSTISDIGPNDDGLITSLLINNSGEDDAGEFFIGSLNPGNYQLAFTCNGAEDTIEIHNAEVEFYEDAPLITVPAGGAADLTEAYPFEAIIVL